jgi:predicted NAD-dependent protein-ADP-ribosyltransferase YbiA (DUF1768 family)
MRQNKEIKGKLLETGEKIIVEASPRDWIWGIGFGGLDLGDWIWREEHA